MTTLDSKSLAAVRLASVPSDAVKLTVEDSEVFRWVRVVCGHEDCREHECLAMACRGRGNRKVFLCAFIGRSAKRAWCYYFNEEASAEKRIEGLRASRVAHREAVAKRKAERSAPPTTPIKPGDIYVSTWGYEQTNVSFFEVASVNGSMVEFHAISKRDAGRDTVVPVPGSGGKLTFKRRMTTYEGSPRFKIDEVRRAHPWNGRPEFETPAGFGH